MESSTASPDNESWWRLLPPEMWQLILLLAPGQVWLRLDRCHKPFHQLLLDTEKWKKREQAYLEKVYIDRTPRFQQIDHGPIGWTGSQKKWVRCLSCQSYLRKYHQEKHRTKCEVLNVYCQYCQGPHHRYLKREYCPLEPHKCSYCSFKSYRYKVKQHQKTCKLWYCS